MPTNKNSLIFVVLPIIAVLFAVVFYYRSPSRNIQPPTWDRDWQSPKVLTKEELAQANGKNGANSYLCVLGEIYDVTGSEHYQEGSGYYVFIGQDASLAFVAGNFNDTATDDVSVLDAQQIKGIEDWCKFYRTHEKYKFVGVLQGRYYNAKGRRTKQWMAIRDKMESADKERLKAEEELKQFPACNSRWTQNEGSTIWCEDSMVKRNLGSPLVPRMIDSPPGTRCICIEWSEARADTKDTYKTYPGCGESHQTCHIKPAAQKS